MEVILKLLCIQEVLSVQFWKHAGIDSTQLLLPEHPLQPAVITEALMKLLLPQERPS